MKEPRFTDQQIAFIRRQADDAADDEASVLDACREAGISLETYHRWRRKYGGLTPAGLSRLQLLENENTRLKELVAKLIIDTPPTTQPTGEPQPSNSPPGDDTLAVPFTQPTSVSLAVPSALVDDEPTLFESIKQSAEHILLMRHALLAHAQDFARNLAARVRRLGPGLLATRAAVVRFLQSDGRGAVLVRDAALWVRARVAQLSWAQVPALAAQIGRRVRDESKGREILIAGVVGGLVAGFAVGLESTPLDESGPPTAPVDTSIRLNSYGSVSTLLKGGWDRPQPWGTWMSGNSASILLGFDALARGDVDLLLEARTQPLQGIEPPTVIVRFNDAELGRWQLPAQARRLRRRFIIPAAVFNRRTDAQLSFEIAATSPTPTVFGVEGLSLRDARHLTDFKGFLDHCSQGKLVGWAIAENTAVSVTASVNGQPIKAVLTSMERPDLASKGLPDDAGFVLTPAQPIAAGSRVEVRFANGRPLIGSPCQP
jgi:putative transposase